MSYDSNRPVYRERGTFDLSDGSAAARSRRRLPRVGRRSTAGFGIAAVVGLAVLAGAANLGYTFGTVETRTDVTVTKTERVCDTTDEGTSCRYLVFTDKGTFENTDTLLHGKFNSSDVHGSLEDGETYDLTVYGWRLPIFSVYPNVIEVEVSGISE